MDPWPRAPEAGCLANALRLEPDGTAVEGATGVGVGAGRDEGDEGASEELEDSVSSADSSLSKEARRASALRTRSALLGGG